MWPGRDSRGGIQYRRAGKGYRVTNERTLEGMLVFLQKRDTLPFIPASTACRIERQNGVLVTKCLDPTTTFFFVSLDSNQASKNHLAYILRTTRINTSLTFRASLTPNPQSATKRLVPNTLATSIEGTTVGGVAISFAMPIHHISSPSIKMRIIIPRVLDPDHANTVISIIDDGPLLDRVDRIRRVRIPKLQ